MSKNRNRIYGQLTLVAEFFVRVQVVKVAEEPLLTTYATPPDCETKRRRGRKVREREEERNRQRRGYQVSRRKDNVNIKNLSKIRNSI